MCRITFKEKNQRKSWDFKNNQLRVDKPVLSKRENPEAIVKNIDKSD